MLLVLFVEEHARLLLVLHAIIAAALVAVSTHLVVWMRGYPRGRFTRQRGVRRFAVIGLALYGATFLLGNLIYPVYKVRVRTEYLDNPAALVADYKSRTHARDRVRSQHRRLRQPALGADNAGASSSDNQHSAFALPSRAAKIARWFDVKEHWMALGFALYAALAVVLVAWKPKADGGPVGVVVFAMAVLVAGTTWLGALIGLVVSSWRAVGGFT